MAKSKTVAIPTGLKNMDFDLTGVDYKGYSKTVDGKYFVQQKGILDIDMAATDLNYTVNFPANAKNICVYAISYHSFDTTINPNYISFGDTNYSYSLYVWGTPGNYIENFNVPLNVFSTMYLSKWHAEGPINIKIYYWYEI